MKKLMSLGLMVGLMALVPSAVMAETHISTNVDVPSTWYAAGSPYIVDNTISVNSDLTIEPGVTVQMNANIVLYVNGTLNAAGTAVSPIVFTGTTQSPNWWNSIWIQGAGSATMEYCTVEYGGYWDGINIHKTGTGNLTMSNCTVSRSSANGLRINGSTGIHTITDCTFSNNAQNGLVINNDGNSAVNASGCTFDSNNYGIYQTSNQTIDYSLNTFTANTTASVAVEGGTVNTNIIWSPGLDAATTFNILGNLTVASGSKLIVLQGTTVTFNANIVLYVKGTLDARGTLESPITFTGSTPSPNWWNSIYIQDPGSATLDYCTVSCGGYWDGANVNMSGTGSLSITNSTLSYSGADGIWLRDDLGLCSFANNHYAYNGRYGVHLGPSVSYDDNTSTFESNGCNVFADGFTSSSSVVWNVNKDYSVYMSGNITVDSPHTMTVKPGTVVKVCANGIIIVNGILDASGTASDPIYFTDARDDSVGGDSNNNGSADGPAPNWWNSIFVQGSGSATLANCTVRYGGYWDGVNIHKSGTGNLTIGNSTVSNSSGHGLRITDSTGIHTLTNSIFKDNAQSGLLLNTDSNTATNAMGCAFENNNFGVFQSPSQSINYGANSFAGNATAAVGVAGGTIGTDVMWGPGLDPSDIEFNVVGNLTIAPSSKLTVIQGTSVTFNANIVLYVKGILDAQGTANYPIAFTGKTQSPNWWNSIFIQDSGSAILDHCTVSYGGYWDGANVNMSGTGSLSITNSTLSYSGADGLWLRDDLGVCSFANNHYAYNGRYGVHLGPSVSYDDNTSTFESNGCNIFADGFTSSSSVVWNVNKDYSVYMSGNVTVNSPHTMTVKPGTVVKVCANGIIIVNGILDASGTASDPIYFTDARDDSVGGDSNNNGSADGPAPNWWNSIFVQEGGSATLANCTVRYGGYWDSTNIYKTGTGSLTITDSTISNSSVHGLRINNSTGIHTLTNCVFKDNAQNGLLLENDANTPTNATGCTFEANNYGVVQTPSQSIDYGVNTFTGNATAAVGVWGGNINADVTWKPGIGSDFCFHALGNLTLNAGKTLTVAPGTTVKFNANIPLFVQGMLNAQGTFEAPITFTGTTESPNWWNSIFIQDPGSAVMDYCHVSYGGYWDGANVIKTGSGNLSLTNSIISSSSNQGLRIAGSTGTHNIIGNTFTNNPTGIFFSNPPAGLMLSNNKIIGNANWGAYNESTIDVDARNNYWGSVTGPYNDPLNPGGQGDKVSAHILFSPWTTGSYVLTYTAGLHGSIQGLSPQFVSQGGSGSPVTAVPDDTYYFVSWSDGLTANPRQDTNVSSDISVTALFANESSHTVTFTAGANGSIVGISPQPVPDGGSTSAVTAVPNQGYMFVKWTKGDADFSTDNPLVVTDVTSDMDLVAQFATKVCIVNFSAEVGGSISGEAWQEVPFGGSTSAVEAVPDEGFKFAGWIGDLWSEDNPLVISNVTFDMCVTARFTQFEAQLTVLSSPEEGGSTTPAGTITVDTGVEIYISALPAAGYAFGMWGTSSTSAVIADRLSSTTTVKVFEDTLVSAVFKQIKKALKLDYPNGGETLYSHTTQNILWTSGPQISDVKLEYSSDLGENWNVIEESVPNSGLYTWTVPEPPAPAPESKAARKPIKAAVSRTVAEGSRKALAAARAAAAGTKNAPAKGASIIYQYGFEDGLGDWTQTVESGVTEWNVVDNSEDIFIMNPDINPNLVSLPDGGMLPKTSSGTKAAWFGMAGSGTFIGTFNPNIQGPKNGGTSTAVQRGDLDSPEIDLAGASLVKLNFRTWWEAEGVDIADGQYDQMRVFVSADGGAYNMVGTINPLNDVNGESFRPYTTGGLGEPGVWVPVSFDFSQFAGQKIKIRFQFDTRDALYNGFRGWLIDDVTLVAETVPAAPQIAAVVPGAGLPGDLVSIVGSNFVTGATVRLGETAVQSAVISQNEAQFVVPYLAPATYDVFLINPDGQGAMKPLSFTIPSGQTAPSISSIEPASGINTSATDVTVYGGNFASGAKVYVAGGLLSDIVFVSESEIKGTVPAGLPPGYQNVEVVNPDGLSALLVGGFQVTEPTSYTWLVRVTDAGDPAVGDQSDTGFQVLQGTVYTVNFVCDPAEGSIAGVNPQVVAEGCDTQPVTAVGKAGCTFEKWTKDGADYSFDNPLVVYGVSADMDITAVFSAKTCVVTFASEAGGSVEGETQQFVEYGGSTSEVTAVPDADHVFSGWVGSYYGYENPLVLAGVTSDMFVTATFTGKSANLTMAAQPSIGGTTLPEPGTHAVGAGAPVEISASPAPFYTFNMWKSSTPKAVIADALAQSTTVTLYGDAVLTALFLPAKKSITVLYPNGGETLVAGTTETILWTSQGPTPKVKLEYSRDLGGTWETIQSDEPNDGSFDWTVPAPLGGKKAPGIGRKPLPAKASAAVPAPAKKALAAARKAAISRLAAQQPKEGTSIIYQYGFENGLGAWTAQAPESGATVWNAVDNSQAVTILNPAINPDLVSLPDDGALPAAYGGTKAAWFGSAGNGTFIGDFNPSYQYAKNGGTSTAVQRASLDSPAISLAGKSLVKLKFWTWWEAEGVDIADGQYDQMRILVSTDAGSTYQFIGTINPLNDANGESFRPYTTGGLGEPGVWVPVTFDLSAFAGQADVRIRFQFDTKDALYNGFRGWLIDDVQVLSETVAAAPVITDLVPPVGMPGSLVSLVGDNFVVGATVTVGGAAVTSSVVSQAETQFTVPYLAPGDYDVSLVNPDGKTALSPVKLTIPAEQTPPYISCIAPNVGMQSSQTAVVICGQNFKEGARAYVADAELLDVTVGDSEIAAVVPAGLPVGFQNVRVVNPDGLGALLTGGFEVKADTGSQWLIRISDVSDPLVSDQSDSGFNVVEGETAQLTMAASPADGGATVPAAGTIIVVARGVARNIMATPAQNFHFTGWTATENAAVADPADSITTVTLAGDAAVTANFAADTATLTTLAEPASGGAVEPASGEQPMGVPVLITATPVKGYNFIKWAVTAGAATIVGANVNPTTVTLSGDATVTAYFSNAQPGANVKLTMAVNDPAMGSTVPAAGEGNATMVKSGTPFYIKATPAEPPAGEKAAGKGYYFAGWTANVAGAVFGNASLPSTTVTLYEAATVTANFAAIPDKANLTMGVTPHYGGGTTPEEGETHEYDTLKDIAISAIPSSGWYFIRWDIVGGAAVKAVFSANTTAQLFADAAITAVFSENPPETVNILMASEPGDGGSTDPEAGAYPVNLVDGTAEFSVAAAANDGFTFSKWIKVDSASYAVALENEYLDETTATVAKIQAPAGLKAEDAAPSITAVFAPKGSGSLVKSAKIASAHKEYVTKVKEDEDVWYEQHSKDTYSISAKFDVSSISDEAYKAIGKETPVSFIFGSLYDISESGFESLGDAQKQTFKGEKGGSAVFTLKETDDNEKEKTVEKITFKWSKIDKKELIVSITGKPLEDSDTNILDLSDSEVGPVSGEVKGIYLEFGGVIWNLTDAVVKYAGKKKYKELEKDDETFDLYEWSVKGKAP